MAEEMYRNSQAPAKESKYKFENGRMIERYPQQAPKQRGKGGFLSSIISELGGAGGAATGAAIGAGFGGIGAIPGAIIGGFLGGTSGKVAENKIRDNQNFFGAGGSAKSAFGEGVLSGALSGAGEAYQLAKAGKAITGTSKLLHPVQNISAGIAEKNAGKAYVGAIETAGKGFMASGQGLAQGASAKGVDKIGFKQMTDYQNTLKALGIKSGSPEAIQAAVEKQITIKGQELANKYAINNVVIDKTTIDALKTSMLKEINGKMGVTSAGTKFGKSQLKKLANVEDMNSFWKKSVEIGDSIKFGDTTSTVAERSQVATIIRDQMKKYINKTIPSLEGDNFIYHNLKDINALTKAASTNTKGGGVVSKLSTLQPVKALEAKIGSGVATTGKYLAGTGGPTTKLTNQLMRQAPGSLTRAISGTMQPLDQTQMDQSQGQDMQGQDIYGGQNMGGMQSQNMGQTSQTQQSAYPLEQALRDINSTNNPKYQQQIMDRYDFVQKAEASQAGGPQKYNSTAAGVIADTTTGLQALQDLKATVASSKINAPIIGQLRGMNPYDTKAQNLQSQIGIVKQIVGKALEGGVLRKEDEIKYAKILPKLGDSQAVAQNKINQLYGLITQRLSLYKESISGTGGTDLSSVIQGYGAQ